MNGIPDPRASRAVLIGVSQYEFLGSLPAVVNNLSAMAGVLSGSLSWELPDENCVVIGEPDSPARLIGPVRQAAEQATDTLLLYFSGHGLLDRSGGLFLGLPGAQSQRAETGAPYHLVRDALSDSRAQRHVVILDCCFSARALGMMGGTEELADQAEIEGSYLLAAAPETGMALAPQGETYTAFTGALLDLLANGAPHGPEWLDMDTVYHQLYRRLRAQGRPLPQKRDRNTAGGLLLSRNAAYRPPAATAETGGRGISRDLAWPNPESALTAANFRTALAQVRAVSGLTQATVSSLSDGRISAKSVGALVNRTTLPSPWRTIKAYLEACGVPPDQVVQWEGVWRQLKSVQPESMPASSEADQLPEESRRWITKLRRRRRDTEG